MEWYEVFHPSLGRWERRYGVPAPGDFEDIDEFEAAIRDFEEALIKEARRSGGMVRKIKMLFILKEGGRR